MTEKPYITKFKSIIWLILVVAIVGAFFGLPQYFITDITNWLISIGIGIILSGISGEFVEIFSGNLFKKIFIPVKVGPINFSIPAFIIVTFIVKLWIFG